MVTQRNAGGGGLVDWTFSPNFNEVLLLTFVLVVLVALTKKCEVYVETSCSRAILLQATTRAFAERCLLLHYCSCPGGEATFSTTFPSFVPPVPTT